MRTTPLATWPACALLALAACSRPEPPPTEQRPEPQSTTRDAGLRETIQRPIDRAKAVEPEVLEAAKKQQRDIDAQAQ